MLCINYRKRLKPRLQTFETVPQTFASPGPYNGLLEDDAK